MRNILLLGAIFFCSQLLSQIPSYVSVDDLVGWWPFNGNAIDESGTGNNGTVISATLGNDRNNNSNSAYLLDGLDDYIQVPHSNSFDFSNGFSISMWVRMDGEGLNTNNFYTFISKNNTNLLENDLFHIMNSSPVYLQTQTGQYNTISGISNWEPNQIYIAGGNILTEYGNGFYGSSQWHHVAVNLQFINK